MVRRTSTPQHDMLFHRIDPIKPLEIPTEVTPLLMEEEVLKTTYRASRSIVRAESHALASLASQMLLCNLLDFLPNFVSAVYTGHLSQEHASEFMAAKSLSGVFMTLAGYSLTVALGTAMGTLCTQAAGAGKLHEMGVFFQCGLFLFLVACIPVALVSYFCVDVLVLLGQRHDIALLTRDLVWYALLGLPTCAVNTLLWRLLEGQNLIRPLLYAEVASNMVYISLSYVLMFHTDMGYLGSAVAIPFQSLCFTLVLALYIVRTPLIRHQWTGWKWTQSIAVLPEFVRLGLSGLSLTLFEFWGFCGIELLAGLLPLADVALSSDAMYMSFRILCSLIYGSIAGAGAVRVGNALGANDPHRAKMTAYLSVGVVVLVSFATSILMFALSTSYPFAYTDDEDVVELTSALMRVTCPVQVFAGVSSVVLNIYRGCGYQILGAKVNLVAFVFTALPLGYFLGFKLHLGLVGLWFGLCAGFILSGVYGLYWLYAADWTAMAEEAQQRTRMPDEAEQEITSC